MKIKGDEKLTDEQKQAQIAPLQAEIKKDQELAEKAEHAPFVKKLAVFVEADKAGKQDELKKLIGEFAAAAANPATN
jgi:lipase chaperone LimK